METDHIETKELAGRYADEIINLFRILKQEPDRDVVVSIIHSAILEAQIMQIQAMPKMLRDMERGK